MQRDQFSSFKTIMLGAAAHEFRNPLSSVISMLTLLENESQGKDLSKAFKDYIKIAKSSSNLLLFLSNDILDYAQIESGQLRLAYSMFDPQQAINEIKQLMNFKAESKNINIKSLTDKTDKIRSDENRFK